VSSTLFISDLHLDPARPAVTGALGAFLEKHRDCAALYILGDLFESWVGDDEDTELANEVRGLLKRFTDNGPALFIMQGNRDFLLGEAFCRATGARLLPDPSVISLCGIPTLLMHGDSLCTADIDYQAFRRTSRDPAWQRDVLGRSLQQRRDLACQLRQMSQAANSNKAEDIMDVTPTEVRDKLREYQVRQLIHGHTHRPARHEHPDGVRWVLGDWDRHGWVLEATSEGIYLNNFQIIQ
jgi:UDP-2,3-diacylglucosamine hydrolase